MGRGMHALVLIAALAAAGFGMHAAAPVLVPVLIGFTFAAAARPFVKFLDDRNVHPHMAVVVAMFGMLLVLAAASGTIVFGVVNLAADLPRYEAGLARVQGELSHSVSALGLHPLATLIQEQRAMHLFERMVNATVDAAPGIMAAAALAALIAFFGLLERDSLGRKLGVDAVSHHTYGSWRRIAEDIQRYLGIKTLVSALTGACAALACNMAGVSNAGLWGAVAFWLNFVPVLGSLVAAIPPVIIALVMKSPENAVALASAYGLINLGLGNVLEPRWQGQAADLSPLMIVLSLALWSGLLGVFGAILAVPLTMVIKIGCYHTRDLHWVARLLDNGALSKSDPPLSEKDTIPGAVRPSMFF